MDTMSVAEIVARRGIREVVHFTTNRGLVGMLHGDAVLSRQALEPKFRLENVLAGDSIYNKNAVRRWDEDWFDYINLSVSRINRAFFAVCSEKWYKDRGDLFWVLLAFDPVIMTHDGVYFATTNNGYEPNVVRGVGPGALERLFGTCIAERVGKVITRPGGHPEDWTTCPQAEVLYPRRLPLDFLRTVYVHDAESRETIIAQCRNLHRPAIPVVVDPSRFT